MYEIAGLNAPGIVAIVLGALDVDHQPARLVGELGLR
jgi:hypothetical protein